MLASWGACGINGWNSGDTQIGRNTLVTKISVFFPILCKQKTLLRRADAQVILVAAENFENGVGRSPGQQLI
jgi:hypothetical protein